MKKIKKILAVVMCVMLIAPLMPGIGLTDMIGRVFAALTGDDITIQETYTLEGTSAVLTANVKSGIIVGDYTWEWVSDNTNVVNVTPTADKNKVTLTRTGIGSANITLTVKEGAEVQTEKTIKVLVPVKIDSTGILDNNKVTVSGKTIIMLKTGQDTTPIINTTEELKIMGNPPVNQVVWESSAPDIVSVDSEGYITAKSAGIATITAKAADGSPTADSIDVEVIAKLKDPTKNYMLVSSIDGDSGAQNEKLNDKLKSEGHVQLYANTDPSTDAVGNTGDVNLNSKLKWNVNKKDKMGNPRVISVDDKGRVSMVGAGEATVKVESREGSKYYAEASFKIPFELKKEIIILNVGDQYTVEHNALAEEGNGPNKSVVYGIQGDTVAVVGATSGIITALKPGETELTATLNDTGLFALPQTYKCRIIVIDGLSINSKSVNINAGTPMALLNVISTSTAPITWSSDNSIVKVEGVQDGNISNATITGSAAGKATITATQIIDGVTKKVTCEVTVLMPITSMTLNKTDETIMKGDALSIIAEFNPKAPNGVSDEYLKSIKWETSDSSILEFRESQMSSAVFVGKSSGYALITAIAYEGKWEDKDNDGKNDNYVVLASCRVLVKEPVTGVVIPAAYKGLTVDLTHKQVQLLANVLPENATNKTIRWQSSDTSKATVNPATGLVTFVSPGEVVITAVSEENKEAADYATIYIRVPIKSITVDTTQEIIGIGDKFRITYLILPNNATNKQVTWSTTDEKIATVDEEGYVTGVGAGKCAIMVRTEEGGMVATCNVTVVQNIDGVILDYEELEINKGDSIFLQATVTPLDSTDKSVTWSSSNSNIATISNTGKLTGVATGTVVITVKTTKGHIAQCTVNVIQPVNLVKMSVSKKTIDMGKTFKLTATVYPNDATYKTLTWTSSNKKVAKVNKNGKVTGVSGGKAIISAISEAGAWDYCTVTVNEKVSSVTLNKTSANINLGKKLKLTATVKSDTATNKKLTWTSSNTKVATVNNKGRVTAKKIGKAVITAKAKDGSGKKATSNIRVIRHVTKVSLNRSSISINEGKSTRLTATITPKNATIKNVSWSSSDTTVAEVDAMGTITAIAKGVATITATSTDGSKKKATCIVSVKETVPLDSLTILTTPENATLTVGETLKIQTQTQPENTNDGLSWISDNDSVATIDNSGRVTARFPGSANITVTSDSGKTASCMVTVVGLSRTNLTLEQYSNFTLTVDGVTSGVRWEITNPDIAVLSNGLVQARKPGTTTITAIVNGKRLYCRLTVTEIRR